jgi:hypothetical protein
MSGLIAKDINNFESNNAKNVSLFYRLILKAESDRKHLRTEFDIQNDGNYSILTGDQLYTYMDMRLNIIHAANIEQYVYNCMESETRYRI